MDFDTEAVTKRTSVHAVMKLRERFVDAKVYAVGGAVRDVLRGLAPQKDIDVVITGIGADDVQTYLASQGDVALVGKKFGVFVFRARGDAYSIDVALPRTEIAVGERGGYRDFSVSPDPRLPIEQDLARRDFTMNAIAVDLSNGKISDPYKGTRDISRRVIRAVGDARARFREDKTRVLRAIRFACSLGFEIEQSTWDAIAATDLGITSDASVIPPEMIARELVRATAHAPDRALELLDRAHLLEQIFPEVKEMKSCMQSPTFHSEGNVFIHSLDAVRVLESDEFRVRFGARISGRISKHVSKHISRELPYAIFFHDVGKPQAMRESLATHAEHPFFRHDEIGSETVGRILRRLRFESVEGFDVEKVIWLVKMHLFSITCDLATVKRTTIEKQFLARPEYGDDLLRLMFADLSASKMPKGSHADLGHLDELERMIERVRTIGFDERMQPAVLLTGSDIISELQIPQGKQVGELLRAVREAQLTGAITTRDEALAMAKQFLK